jgi:ferredoxin-thioredoxin reductase catalytic subunit
VDDCENVSTLNETLRENERLTEEVEMLRAVLRGLVNDCADYEAWQRPCLAYELAVAALAEKPK